MKIVIIEDEQKTAKNLGKAILSVLPQAEILHYIESVEEGRTFFQNTTDIDLIFSDIQLGDGLCFDIFEKINIEIPIIYCTAYNEYALRAFKNFGIDYILKPFSESDIQQAIQKYQALSAKSNSTKNNVNAELIAEIKRQLSPKKTAVIVFRGDKIIPIETESIAFLYIENTIVYAFTFDGKKLSTTYKLDDLEQKLYPQFFRANRQFLVNRKAIKEASQYFNRKIQIHLTISFSEVILVGKEKVTLFLNWLAQ